MHIQITMKSAIKLCAYCEKRIRVSRFLCEQCKNEKKKILTKCSNCPLKFLKARLIQKRCIFCSERLGITKTTKCCRGEGCVIHLEQTKNGEHLCERCKGKEKKCYIPEKEIYGCSEKYIEPFPLDD